MINDSFGLWRIRKMNNKPVLDVCCGGKMFYFDKTNENVLFCDKRKIKTHLCDNRKFEVNPDIVCDFTDLPFKNETFYHVVFDPPHLKNIGENSYMAIKYGRLNEDWETVIKQGFNECMRVLKIYGTLIFKWNEEQIKLKEILNVIDYQPLYGNRRAKTHWLVFIKGV